ncbi:acyloxyacyl hydrolase [Pararhodospirillum photometricum]|nr:acyloxyacyl hydrolase [Pararhodospirillum photometricum]
MPNTALGYYQRGGGRDLGYPLEFRSGLEIGWRFDGGMRAGVAMHHLSNANIGDRNPGVEELSLNLSIPLASVTGLVK